MLPVILHYIVGFEIVPLPIPRIILLVSFFFALSDVIPPSALGIINTSVTIGKPIVFVSVWVHRPIFRAGMYSFVQELSGEYIWLREQSKTWPRWRELTILNSWRVPMFPLRISMLVFWTRRQHLCSYKRISRTSVAIHPRYLLSCCYIHTILNVRLRSQSGVR